MKTNIKQSIASQLIATHIPAASLQAQRSPFRRRLFI
jgi:hypothetical protein